MRAQLQRYFDAPPGAAAEATQKLRLLGTLSFVGSAGALCFALGHAFVLHWPPGAAWLLGTALGFLSVPAVARRFGIAVGATVQCAVLFVMGLFLSLWRDDAGLPILMFFVLLPILAAWLTGPRSVWVWSGLSVAAAGVFWWRAVSGQARLAPALAMLSPEVRVTFDAMTLVAFFVSVLVLSLSLEYRRHEVSAAEVGQLQAALQLRRLESVTRLAGGVAHEINNPLAWTVSSVSFLSRWLTEPPQQGLPKEGLLEAQECVRDALEGCGRVRDIVRDLQLLARAPDAAGPDGASVREAVESAVLLARSTITRKARLTLTLGETPLVRGHQAGLAEVVLNLLLLSADACEHAPAPTIEVRSRQCEGRVEVEVAHTGQGLPLDGALTLSLCQTLLGQVGGTLEQPPRPDGACFVAKLPCLSTPTPPLGSALPEGPRGPRLT